MPAESNESKVVGVAVFKAPDDPDEKKAWAHQMMRIQVAMWVDGKTACAACGVPYASVDDFLARNPRAGPGWPDDWSRAFIDSACWTPDHDREVAARAR